MNDDTYETINNYKITVNMLGSTVTVRGTNIGTQTLTPAQLRDKIADQQMHPTIKYVYELMMEAYEREMATNRKSYYSGKDKRGLVQS